MSLNYNNLDQCSAFQTLLNKPEPQTLKEMLNPERIQNYQIQAGAGLCYNYAAKWVDDFILDALQKLSDEQQLIGKYRQVIDGEEMNTGEKRKVLHHLMRGQLGKDVVFKDKNLRAFYLQQLQKIFTFADSVHTGAIRSSNEKPFTAVVQIGIGGSDLGPRALAIALKNWAAQNSGGQKLAVHFVSNVDPDDINEVAQQIDLETALFIIVSKSGTTPETLTNEAMVRDLLQRQNLNPQKHLIAVTSETSPMAQPGKYLECFFIDDFIGGRYSSTSAVGAAILALGFGRQPAEELLAGAAEADQLALNPNLRKNAAMMDAMIGVYERNILGYPTTAVLPYSQALLRFPAHLQQLDMESNGKSVNRFGQIIHYATGPVLFGEPGTNGQHSFYQLLHQGTNIIPLQFIGFKKAQTGYDCLVDGSTSMDKLKANLAAQITAFAVGKNDANLNKNFIGGRPSSLLYAQQLTPRVLGALLAHFENKVMFQGFVWNVNSFDQEGVQLGKVLTQAVLSGNRDPILEAYYKLLL